MTEGVHKGAEPPYTEEGFPFLSWFLSFYVFCFSKGVIGGLFPPIVLAYL